MSVICAVKFADGVVTRMTVWDYGNGLNVGPALTLAVAAYESRMKRPPPLIEAPESIAGNPDILGLQYKTADGKVFTTTAAEYKRMLLFASIFDTRDNPGNDGEPTTPQHNRGRRPRPRSTAEWEEQNRRRDLRRLARADAALRRELLKTFDTCPCCERSFERTTREAPR